MLTLSAISLCAASSPALLSADSAINAMANALSAIPTSDQQRSFEYATNALSATIKTSAWYVAVRESRTRSTVLNVRG
jgi:hypothetical protein